MLMRRKPRIRDHSLFMPGPGWVGKIHQKAKQNVLTPPKEKDKCHDSSKCTLKTR